MDGAYLPLVFRRSASLMSQTLMALEGRGKLSAVLLVMNSKARAPTQSEDDGLGSMCVRPRARDSMLLALDYNW